MSSNSNGYRAISDIGPSNVCSTAKAQLGDRLFQGGNEYVYLYNSSNSQISQGLGVILTATSGYSVTASSITGVDNCAGYNANATAATADYFWGLT